MPAIGLPSSIRACLFDLDGVLTETATLHFEAWKQTFDDFLAARSGPDGDQSPFSHQDYLDFVDGKPRYDGVRSFLASRSVVLPEVAEAGSGSTLTIQQLGDRKNELVNHLMRTRGVRPFEGSRRYLELVRERQMPAAVVSASANARPVLEAAGLLPHFAVVVDGIVARTENLRGKPHPDTFLHAARLLGTDPEHACVFEDALAGVQAGRDGGFGFVVGVDRADQAGELAARGADIVVNDLADLIERN